MKNAIAYERVSTAGQRRSGLGLEAQRATIARFAAQEGFRIVESFAEAETGKGADALARRPKLAAALFMLHIYSALVENERRLISERTKLGLAAAKARGVKLGGRNAQSDRTAAEAAERAERLRPILTELADLSANRAAAELNRRKVAK